MRILKIELYDLPHFESPLIIDLFAQKSVTQPDKDKLFSLSEKYYLNPVIAFIGLNASGKTTILNAILFVLNYLQNVPINKIDEVKSLRLKPGSRVRIKTYFSHDNDIWLLKSEILRKEESGEEYIFTEEKISLFKNGIKKPKNQITNPANYTLTSTRKEIEEYLASDASMIIHFSNKHRTNLYVSNYLSFTNHNLLNVITNFPEELLAFLDPSIEYLRFDINREDRICEGVRLKFHDSEEFFLSSPDQLEVYLSSGTIKGLGLFVSAVVTMINGGYLVIDELENHFNTQITASLIQLFLDPKININGGILIFSTHYPFLLDQMDRTDCIYLLRHAEKIRAIRLDSLIKRKDLKKSDIFIAGYLEGTAPDYLPYRNLVNALSEYHRGKRIKINQLEVGHG